MPPPMIPPDEGVPKDDEKVRDGQEKTRKDVDSFLTKGDLREWYGQAAPDGGPLRLRRLEQAARLELVQVTNDPPPYWFVLIRNFDQSPNGIGLYNFDIG